jgi:hypothetical protein
VSVQRHASREDATHFFFSSFLFFFLKRRESGCPTPPNVKKNEILLRVRKKTTKTNKARWRGIAVLLNSNPHTQKNFPVQNRALLPFIARYKKHSQKVVATSERAL